MNINCLLIKSNNNNGQQDQQLTNNCGMVVGLFGLGLARL